MAQQIQPYHPTPSSLATAAGWTMADMERAAIAIAKSGLFGVKTPEQALALMLLAQGMNIHPALAAQLFHIIDGRPAMSAQAMLARFQQMGGKVEWLERGYRKVSARFSHPQGGMLVVTWTLDDAQRAGLAQRANWRRYPRQMLTARVIGEGVRTIFPAAALGFYTIEEAADIVADETGRLPVNVLEEAGYDVMAMAEAEADEPSSHPEATAEGTAAVEEPDPATSPDVLVATLKARAADNYRAGFKFNNRPGAIGLLANALEQIWGGGEAAVEWRRWFLYGAFGKTSLKELGDHTLKAMLDTLLPEGSAAIPAELAEQVKAVAERASEQYLKQQIQAAEGNSNGS